jgi:hypothetical protein
VDFELVVEGADEAAAAASRSGDESRSVAPV